MQYDSNYRAKDSIKKINTQLIDCAHGHICCDVNWCDCCPEKNRTKSLNKVNKLPVLETPVCKHGYDQELGKACSQCMNEDRMKQDSTNKAIKLVTLDSIMRIKAKSQADDCAHSHICCQIGCYCCQINKKKMEKSLFKLSEEFSSTKSTTIPKKKLKKLIKEIQNK
jgi:hypothetical protein